MRTRIVIPLYGVWMLALTAAFYVFPAWHLVIWSSLALSSAGAIAAGVRGSELSQAVAPPSEGMGTRPTRVT